MASNDEKGRQLDGRYKQGVDKGAMSSLSIPLPMKPMSAKPKFPADELSPIQKIRQAKAIQKAQRK